MIERLGYSELKTRHRKERVNYAQPLSLRVHRALSWLNRAEQEVEDLDAQFIFLWIAFNAAYANEIHDRRTFTERRLSLNFLNRLIERDDSQVLQSITWQEFPKSIRLLLDNRYVFQPFWDFHNCRKTEDEWMLAFEKSKSAANRALGDMNTTKVLAIVFDRLYVLRNQLVHGGATWNGGVNRDQIRDGVAIMGRLVPSVITIMMDHGNAFWGEACYPVVD